MASPTVSASRTQREAQRSRTPARVANAPAVARRRLSAALWLVLALFAVIVAAAGLQIRLITGQRQLDRLEGRIANAQVRQYNLRQQEAMLRSPAQITQIAANDLGMVQAAPPALITPPPQVLGASEPQSPTEVATPTVGGAAR